jgi:hypothetical protein
MLELRRRQLLRRLFRDTQPPVAHHPQGGGGGGGAAWRIGCRLKRTSAHVCCCSTDLLALPTCDPDKTFAVQISHEETMVSGPVSFVQCALLHTSSSGERRIR